jgi:hypothetical protein
MLFVRRRLSWLVCMWLTCQVAGFAAAPIAFCCKDVPTANDEQDCCEGLQPGQYCPMHHKTAGGGKNECKMRSACAPVDAMLVALAGGTGLVERTTAIVNNFVPGEPVAPLAATSIVRIVPPDPPPPRA